MNIKISSFLRTLIIGFGLLWVGLSTSAAAHFSIPITGYAVETENSLIVLPAFESFIAAVTNGDASVVSGVYVPGVLALRVQQQPDNDAGYVSSISGMVTQFENAAHSGVTGLLAHNYLSGEFFFNLEIGQEVIVIYGDGRIQRYSVREIYQYQALQPDSTSSDFIDLSTQQKLSSNQLYNSVYTGNHHVTFQTCISGDGNLNWGRLFVIAYPIDES